MSDFKTRLVEEKQQLDEKRIKLEPFLGTAKFNELPEIQKCLLRAQSATMATYSQILDDRLSNLD